MKIYNYPKESEWQEILKRPLEDQNRIDEAVMGIIDMVKSGGDKALKELTQKFDHWSPESFMVPQSEMVASEEKVSETLKSAILLARNNIEKFHAAQWEESMPIETSRGVLCWRKSLPIQKVGLYIPGGTAPLISTLLMLGIPALLAGCKEIIVCSPANNGKLHPALLFTAGLLGITGFYKIGGAQAIAAMAFGTESVPSVNKIFGPGNRFVTRAKQIVSNGGVAIDMPAGPSEVAVFADDSCNPAFVAADLLSQAEHGTDSQVVLVTSSEQIIKEVLAEVEIQKKLLPRVKEIESSLGNSKCILLKDIESCFSLLNEYAPEHLIIASQNALQLSNLVINAGSVFLGNFSPESAGDYVSGTNHTLPTNGYAKAYSGVSLDSFIKKVTFQELTHEGLMGISEAIGALADAEGLLAHKNAVLKRIENK